MAENDLYQIIDVFYSNVDLSRKKGNYLMFNIGKGRKNKVIFLSRAEYLSTFEKILGQKIEGHPKLSWDGTWERLEYVLKGELEGISLSSEQFVLLGGTKPKKSTLKPKNYNSFHEYPVKRIRD